MKEPAELDIAEPGPPFEALPPPAFAAKATDLGALRDAVVDAASVGAGLWFSYLFVLLYLGIAVTAITHRDLLFENPVKLPFLGVDLPLTAFFGMAPILFLVVHAYVLLHFVLLAGKVNAFDNELRMQISDDDTRTRLRRQLPSNIFAQFLAGPTEVRKGAVGQMLRIIAWISLVIGPLALLVEFQLQFLAYHHEVITWTHRAAVLIDLALLWTLWPSIVRVETSEKAWSIARSLKLAALAMLSAAPIFLVFVLATFPGETLEGILPSWKFIPVVVGSTPKRFVSPHDYLFVGEVDEIARRSTSLWANHLVLPGLDVIDHSKFDSDEKLAAVPYTLSLRGRRLEQAVFLGANLSKVDLTGAQLQGAILGKARLQKATLDQALMDGAVLNGADLKGASLKGARLQGANFRSAGLEIADLSYSDLRGANLDFARLQVANLTYSKIEGASFSNAGLEGARLFVTSMGGNSFRYARLHGTSLGLSIFNMRAPNTFTVAAMDFRYASFWRAEFAGSIRFKAVASAGSEWSGSSRMPWTYADLKLLVDTAKLPEPSELRRLDCMHPDSTLGSCDAEQPSSDAENDIKKAREEKNASVDFYLALIGVLTKVVCATDARPQMLTGMISSRKLEEVIKTGQELGPETMQKASSTLDECPPLALEWRSQLRLFNNTTER